ncbi:TonB-dependent receptor domain-containing protein [Sphingomonas sp. Leaf339]|uniref:TonB-dependent receptor domain-containing protein n=1 Tax=Sphingomonas sp. Leaf339 TaxID=1736343 RepID=UPI0006F73804|nr:TonB-dependent receptor [Sphingomonas sp. Leaf339]
MVRRTVRRSLLAASCASFALIAASAPAQIGVPTAENPPESAIDAQTPDTAPEPSEEILITGSRIARQDYAANSPIVSLSQDALENTGRVTVESALTQLPQFSGAFGQANGGSTSTGLNGGQAYASLRGLGSKRTLLLLDGRRIQPSNPDGSVDLNIIPDALIENIEVITGGASATYGSDATAGVVNFRLRRNFKGLELNGQTGVSDYGDGNSYRLTGTIGGAFDEGRGRAVLSVDYTKRERALQSARDYYTARQTTPGLATIPQGTVLFGANLPTLASVNGVFSGYGVPALTGNAAGRYTGQIGFNTDQTLFSTVGVPVLNFRDPQTDEAYIVNSGTNSQQVNFGFNGSSLQSDLSRYNVFGKIDYDVTESIKAFVQFSYTSYSSLGITNPTLASNVYGLTVPVTNPFIPAAFRTILASRPTPNGAFTFYKALNILGPRYQTYDYDVYQITTGLSGKIGIRDWTWDLYGSVSKAKFVNAQTGGASASATARLLNSPTGGTELCAGGFNPFGNLTPSQACIDYISRRTVNSNELKQRTVEGNIQGGFVNLPAGEVRFAVGADYRFNGYGFSPDAALAQPDGTSDILGYSVLRPAGGSIDTGEAYAELLVPLLHDTPLIQQLDLDLGYRYSRYNTVGGVHTYKADASWTVFEGLRLRGGYNRAIRAPSVGELFAPVSTGSVAIGTASATTTNGDPCDTRSSYRRGTAAAQVRSLCLAQGIPTTIIDSYQLGTAQVFALTGGNPELEEETADTYSVGGVIQSPFDSAMLKNMSLSVDAYQIKIRDAVGPLSIAQAFQFCFNSGGNNPSYSATNYYCSLITRSTASGVPVNPLQPLLNLGTFQVRGIDVQFDWRFPLNSLGFNGDAGQIALNSAVSYTDSFKIQALPGAPTYDYAGSIGTGVESVAGTAHPRWKSITSLTYSLGGASLGMRWRYISSMKASARVVSPTSTTRGVDKYNVFDLNARFEAGETTEFRLGATNLFNKKPPQVGDIEGTFDAQNYDVMGRYFFIGITKRF